MIDLPTLWAFLALADLLLAAAVGIGLEAPAGNGSAAWSASLGVRCLAFALFALGLPARAATLAVACGLVALSMTLQASALLALERRALPAWVHTAVLAAVAVPFALVAGDVASAILFGGVVFATLLATLAALAWQVRRGAGRFARALLSGAFGVASLACFVRGVAAAFAADPAAPFTAPTEAQAAMFLAIGGGALASTVAYLLLHKDQSDSMAAHAAMLDPLTGTYSRRAFESIAQREMARALRAGQPLSIILLDIDHFRALFEHHGPRVADQVLQAVAQLVRDALRKEDIVVRYGSGEFLVLLPDVAGPGAVVVAGRVRKAVCAEPLGVEALELPVTVSVGVAARLDEGPESIQDLVARADDALGLAKRRGRNRVVALSLGRSIAAA